MIKELLSLLSHALSDLLKYLGSWELQVLSYGWQWGFWLILQRRSSAIEVSNVLTRMKGFTQPRDLRDLRFWWVWASTCARSIHFPFHPLLVQVFPQVLCGILLSFLRNNQWWEINLFPLNSSLRRIHLVCRVWLISLLFLTPSNPFCSWFRIVLFLLLIAWFNRLLNREILCCQDFNTIRDHRCISLS